MCDTFVALPAATLHGDTLFAKNSDRDANEAQALEFHEGRENAPGTRLKVSYIEIDEAPRTWSTLLSRPYWMWGAEMGVNEHGLAIGNEAILTKVAPGREPGLIGMDMVRLGLERAANASEALSLLCSLIETYGQSGNCGHPQAGAFYYHNSFLIADRSEAYVLETIGHDWIMQKVEGVRSISNTITIEDQFDAMSDGLYALAEAHGWKKANTPFNFRKIFGQKILSELASGPARWRRSTSCLTEKAKGLAVTDMIALLRDHGPEAARNPRWRPDGLMNGTICAHASFGPIRKFGQSVGSQVSSLSDRGDVHVFTGTSAPDTGIFKPLTLEAAKGLRLLRATPSGTFDRESLWWRHERLHRAVLEDYAARLPRYRADRDRLEADFVAKALALRSDPASLTAHSTGAWKEADKRLEEWLANVLKIPARDRGSPGYRHHWRTLARRAHFPG